MISTKYLPQIVRDRLELKEELEPTFSRALEIDYTDNFFEVLDERKQKTVEHNVLISWFGEQGCLDSETNILAFRNGAFQNIKISELCGSKDMIVGFDGKKNVILPFRKVFTGKKKCYHVVTASGREIGVSKNHDMLVWNGLDICKQNLSKLAVGDYLVSSEFIPYKDIKAGIHDERIGFLLGIFVSCGFLCDTEHAKYRLGISTDDNLLKDKIECCSRRFIDGKKFCRYDDNVRFKSTVLFNMIIDQFGRDKSVTYSMLNMSVKFRKAFVSGWFSGDGSFMIDKKHKLRITLTNKSKDNVLLLQQMLLQFGIVSSIVKKKVRYNGEIRVYWHLSVISSCSERFLSTFRIVTGKDLKKINARKKNDKLVTLDYIRMFPVDRKLLLEIARDNGMNCRRTRDKDSLNHKLSSISRFGFRGKKAQERLLIALIERYGDKKAKMYYDKLMVNVFADRIVCIEPMGVRKVFDLQVPNYHNFMLSNGLIVGNSSKSYSGLFTCGYLSKEFSIDNIYFDYNQLVNERYKLKPGTAVLIDEQMPLYGVDTNRINIILNALKEQLRKRSVHMVYCSPVLRQEYLTSMFVMETMFIDKEYSESYHAMKTNQLHCLGYVVIPHPLKVISKKLLLEYEKKKDEHLEELTTQPVDDVEERAKTIMKDKVFLQAEKVYKEKIGFIPYRNLVQVISMMFPEFKGSVIVYEVADRIRVKKELDGSWMIAGRSWQQKKLEGEERREQKNKNVEPRTKNKK